MPASRLSEDDPRRSGDGVCVSRSRPMGLCQGRHPGLLTSGKAHGQRLHRSLQRPLPGGMPEPVLVPDPCGCARKDGGLASILQHDDRTPTGQRFASFCIRGIPGLVSSSTSMRRWPKGRLFSVAAFLALLLIGSLKSRRGCSTDP